MYRKFRLGFSFLQLKFPGPIPRISDSVVQKAGLLTSTPGDSVEGPFTPFENPWLQHWENRGQPLGTAIGSSGRWGEVMSLASFELGVDSATSEL